MVPEISKLSCLAVRNCTILHIWWQQVSSLVHTNLCSYIVQPQREIHSVTRRHRRVSVAHQTSYARGKSRTKFSCSFWLVVGLSGSCRVSPSLAIGRCHHTVLISFLFSISERVSWLDLHDVYARYCSWISFRNKNTCVPLLKRLAAMAWQSI